MEFVRVAGWSSVASKVALSPSPFTSQRPVARKPGPVSLTSHWQRKGLSFQGYSTGSTGWKGQMGLSFHQVRVAASWFQPPNPFSVQRMS